MSTEVRLHRPGRRSRRKRRAGTDQLRMQLLLTRHLPIAPTVAPAVTPAVASADVTSADVASAATPNQETDESKQQPSGWSITIFTVSLWIFCIVYFIKCVSALLAEMGP